MARRTSSFALPIIPEGKQPIEYEQTSGRTYVVQHLRGNAVVVRRTSTGGMQGGRRTSLANQPWEHRPSVSSSSRSQSSPSADWASATPTMPSRRSSVQMSPIQMLPPNSLSSSQSAARPSRGYTQSPPPRTSSACGSITESIEEDTDAEMMDVDVVPASPSASAFSTPASSPPTSPGFASPMSHQRPQPSRSPLKKVSSWLGRV